MDLGLVLYHENERHIFGDRLPGVKVIADELRGGSGDGPFRIIFDFDNFNQTGDDVWRNWLELRDQTDGFHVKDSDPNNQHVPAGRGVGKIREILSDALGRGWQGPLTLEPHLAHSAAVLATGPHGSQTSHWPSWATSSASSSPPRPQPLCWMRSTRRWREGI